MCRAGIQVVRRLLGMIHILISWVQDFKGFVLLMTLEGKTFAGREKNETSSERA